jgi:hypothetical protein
MVAILVLWAFTLAACILIGEVVCRLAGWRPWSWLSGTVGIAVLLVIGAAGARLPGHATTSFALVAALAAASAAWIAWSDRACAVALVRRALEPGLLAGFVLAATLIPFLANGRIGLLGPSVNNDMRYHIWAAEYLLAGRPVPEYVLGGGYPLGPHGLVAALAAGLGGGVESGFVALLMAVAVLTAFAARAILVDVPRIWALLVALLAGLTYLLAAYYAQAAFKETLQTLFVLAFAVAVQQLVAEGRLGPRAAPVPALLAAGSLLTYSYPGLAWMASTIALAAVGLLLVHRRSLSRAVAGRWIRRALPTLGVLTAVLLVALAPQAGRIVDFFRQLSLSPSGSGIIPTSNIGNLVKPLSPLQAFGVWLSEDFRFHPLHHVRGDVLSALAVGVAVFGAAWSLRRREIVVVAAAVASGLLYLALRESQSAYLAAKALVILSPYPVLLGARALLARAPSLALPLRGARLAVAAVLACSLGWSSFLALRNGQVEPGAHQRDLVSLRPLLEDRDVLFLGDDDFVGSRLFGARVRDPSTQADIFPLRKPYVAGQPLDFDAVAPRILDRYQFVVTTQTRYASRPPRNFERIRRTRFYDVYERRGRTAATRLLSEGASPGAILDCAANPRDRRLARGAGEALVRPAPVTVQAPLGMGAGASVAAELRLPAAGRWEISLQYTSPQVLRLSTSTGQGWLLPPNLDRLGPFWRAGDVHARGPTTLRIGLYLDRAAPAILTADSQFAPLGTIAAVRTDRPARWVPLRAACGRYVDRYAL